MAKYQRVEIPARAEDPVCSDREETEALSFRGESSSAADYCVTLQFVRLEVQWVIDECRLLFRHVNAHPGSRSVRHPSATL